MSDSPDQTGPSRRTLLRATGLIALTGGGATVLAACGADAETAQQPAATSAPPATTPSPSASSATPKASTSSKPTSKPSPKKRRKAPSGPSVTAADVPVGGGVILENAGFVVTQPTKGSYKAFTKTCTHRGCKVASIKSGNIHCDCHGSEFSIKDGSVTHSPATEPLEEFDTTVFGKKVYVTE
jgi:Rieske Fe-S protein